MEIMIDELEHIAEGSFYNYNFYELPNYKEGMNILLQICDELDGTCEYEIGYFDGETFTCMERYYGGLDTVSLDEVHGL